MAEQKKPSPPQEDIDAPDITDVPGTDICRLLNHAGNYSPTHSSRQICQRMDGF